MHKQFCLISKFCILLTFKSIFGENHAGDYFLHKIVGRLNCLLIENLFWFYSLDLYSLTPLQVVAL